MDDIGGHDFNMDCSADVLLRNTVDGSLSEWLSQAGGTFGWNAPATYGVPARWAVDGAADVNVDGSSDLMPRYSIGDRWASPIRRNVCHDHANANYALNPA